MRIYWVTKKYWLFYSVLPEINATPLSIPNSTRREGKDLASFLPVNFHLFLPTRMTEESTVTTIEELLKSQISTRELIKRISNFNKLGKTKKTTTAVWSRLNTLKVYWSFFLENYARICAETKKESRNSLEYFSDKALFFFPSNLVIPKVTDYMPRSVSFYKNHFYLKTLLLANPEISFKRPIDLIIGADYYGKTLRDELVHEPSGNLTAQLTSAEFYLAKHSALTSMVRIFLCTTFKWIRH